MTPAVRDYPHTALDLLFASGGDSLEALADQSLSAGALRDLPKSMRQDAVREVTIATAALLDVELIDMLVAGWRAQPDLTAAARRTLALPGSAELVDVAAHQITTAQHPSVHVLVDSVRVTTLQLDLSVSFDVSAVLAAIMA